jgi:hypothetical protein
MVADLLRIILKGFVPHEKHVTELTFMLLRKASDYRWVPAEIIDTEKDPRERRIQGMVSLSLALFRFKSQKRSEIFGRASPARPKRAIRATSEQKRNIQKTQGWCISCRQEGTRDRTKVERFRWSLPLGQCYE